MDSLRAFAALAVIFQHVSEYLLTNVPIENNVEYAFYTLTSQTLNMGKIGVVVFFAISGFIVPYSLLKPISEHNPLLSVRNFIIGRLFRLYPAYWLSIPIGVFIYFYCDDQPLTVLTVISNLTMVQQFFGQDNIIGVYWTLQIELVFYALLIVLFWQNWLVSDKAVFITTLMILAAAFVLALLRFYTARKFPVALPLSLAIMLWGLLWHRALMAAPKTQIRFLAGVSLIAILVLLIPICLLAYSRDYSNHENAQSYILSYSIALVIFCLGTSYWRCNNALAAYLGKISYSLYLFGAPVEHGITKFITPHITHHAVALISIVLTFILTILIASATYFAVEKPMMMLGRRLQKF